MDNEKINIRSASAKDCILVHLVTQNYVDLKCTDGLLWIANRPGHCDRGRYLVNVASHDRLKLYIDAADMFPRYYFDFDAMLTEISEWMKARNQECWEISTSQEE